jgi:hypothetical protein
VTISFSRNFLLHEVLKVVNVQYVKRSDKFKIVDDIKIASDMEKRSRSIS